jgi:hypothetical protein
MDVSLTAASCTLVQENIDEGSQRSVILDGSPKSARRLDPSLPMENDHSPSSNMAPYALDGALVEQSTHGALSSEMVRSVPLLLAQLALTRVGTIF